MFFGKDKFHLVPEVRCYVSRLTDQLGGVLKVEMVFENQRGVKKSINQKYHLQKMINGWVSVSMPPLDTRSKKLCNLIFEVSFRKISMVA